MSDLTPAFELFGFCALITVDLEEDEEMPPAQAVDEFSDEFLMQAPRSWCQV